MEAAELAVRRETTDHLVEGEVKQPPENVRDEDLIRVASRHSIRKAI